MWVSTFYIVLLLSLTAFITQLTIAAPLLPRISSHQQQISLFAQNQRPITRDKHSGQNYHEDDDAVEEHHYRTIPANKYYDSKMVNTRKGSNIHSCYMLLLRDSTTPAAPLTFKVHLDNNCYSKLLRPINDIPNTLFMPISIAIHPCSRENQSWYRRLTSLWSNGRYDDNEFSNQLMSMIPIANDDNNNHDRTTLFAQLQCYSSNHHNNDYDQIEKSSIKNDAVLQVISNDVVF